MRFIGFRDEVDGTRGAFQLVFACPLQNQYPESLETHIRTQRAKPSLNFRIDICNQLATAVLQTMTLTLVHKNIRSENILLLPTETTIGAIGGTTLGLFLAGWQYARQVERGVTNYRGETTMHRKIYQHPERQIVEAEKESPIAHDLCSLGVCMIEILTWDSLLLAADPPTLSGAFIAAFKSLGIEETASKPITEMRGGFRRP